MTDTAAVSSQAGGVRGFARRIAALRQQAIPVALLSPMMIAAAAIIGFPVAVVFVESFFDVNPARHRGWIWTGVDNYLRIASDPELAGVLLNSLVWTVGSVFLQFVVAFTAALLVRESLQGRAWTWLRASFILPWATPMIVGATSWRWLYQPQFGLVNDVLVRLGLDSWAMPWLSDPSTALAATIVTNIWRGFPFIMVMLLSGMAAIPTELYEAAEMDGSNPYHKMRYITLPLLRPVILLSTLMSLIWTFNNFGLIFVMTGGGPAGRSEILTTYVYRNAFERFDFGYASALSVFLFAIVAIGAITYIRALGKDALK